jgi:hypothetical protein
MHRIIERGNGDLYAGAAQQINRGDGFQLLESGG